MKSSKKYDANFTAGGLLFHEFRAIKLLFLSNNFIELIQQEKEKNNIIGIATNSARKRIILEIVRRYKKAPNQFWNYFFNWKEEEQKLGLFYLILKAYPLIMDIHIEVTLKKYKTGSELSSYDIQMRFQEIMSQNENVASWSDATLKKLNEQYRKALLDAGVFDGKFLKKPTKATPQFWEYFIENGEGWFLKACFID